MICPLAVNHIGITVPDIHAAIDWYVDVFGFEHIMGPRLMHADGKASSETRELFGPDFTSMLQAHLLSANGIGLELFEPLDPPPLEAPKALGYRPAGVWHVAFQHPDVEGMVDLIVSHGGSRHGRTSQFVPGRPWALAYAKDPWGTTIEIVSHAYALMFGNWPQPGNEAETIYVSREQAEALRNAV
jgi:catechol 2,3-dioxygenase-like lactoylglutathione lyase family enzyme